MDDLVKRLRDKHEYWSLGSKGPDWVLEAANRIEELEAGEKRAKSALAQLYNCVDDELTHRPSNRLDQAMARAFSVIAGW